MSWTVYAAPAPPFDFHVTGVDFDLFTAPRVRRHNLTTRRHIDCQHEVLPGRTKPIATQNDGVSVPNLGLQLHCTCATPRSGITQHSTRLYRASKRDCDGCALKP